MTMTVAEEYESLGRNGRRSPSTREEQGASGIGDILLDISDLVNIWGKNWGISGIGAEPRGILSPSIHPKPAD